MMAIGNFVKEKMPWFKVHYAPAETFQSDLVDTFRIKLASLRQNTETSTYSYLMTPVY